MKLSKMIGAALVVFVIMSGCSQECNDYEKLGFSSHAEMEEAFRQGYHTKRKMDEMTVSKVETVTPGGDSGDRMIGKKDAFEIFMKEFRSMPGYEKMPENERAVLDCAVNILVDEVFKGEVKSIKASSLERRMSEIKVDSSNEEVLKKKTEKCTALLPKKAEAQNKEMTRIDLDDFRLDYKSLVGKTVRVEGVGLYMMDIFMLRKSQTDMSPIIIDTSKVSRMQQKRIMQDCADLMSGCKVTIYGVAGAVNYQNGIIATSVEW